MTSLWEQAIKHASGKLTLSHPPLEWYERLVAHHGLRELATACPGRHPSSHSQRPLRCSTIPLQPSRSARVRLKGADLGAKLLHRSFVWLALAGGCAVAGSWVEQTEKADGIHRPELVGQDGDALAIKLNGGGVSGGSAHEISGSGKSGGMQRIHPAQARKTSESSIRAD